MCMCRPVELKNFAKKVLILDSQQSCESFSAGPKKVSYKKYVFSLLVEGKGTFEITFFNNWKHDSRNLIQSNCIFSIISLKEDFTKT